MDQLPNLGLIYVMSVGLDHLDVEAANTRDIKVTNAPSCADHAFALLLSVSRHILAMTCQCGKTKPMRNAQNFV
jgi:lactate dehydrogenase-like 2-hydroxyacid dehydrogenase